MQLSIQMEPVPFALNTWLMIQVGFKSLYINNNTSQQAT
jgi:hypothetical protein